MRVFVPKTVPVLPPAGGDVHPIPAGEMPRTIFVVRHGESVWNGKKRVSGQLDPPLSGEGKAQADLLGQVLRRERLTAICTSTLKRTVDTARPAAVAHGLKIQQSGFLREQNLGVLEGRFRDHRDPEALRFWSERNEDRLCYRIPGGETYVEMEERVLSFLPGFLRWEAGGTVLIVGHRNTNRIVMGYLLGWPALYASQARLRNKFVYRISPDSSAPIHTISLRLRNGGREKKGFWL